MERQEEKKIKVFKSKRKTQSKSISSFPLELTSLILSKLPARSLARFRCMSKLWLSITTDSYFINLFTTRFLTLEPSLLICFREGENMFVYSIPQHQTLNESNSSSQPIYHYDMKFPAYNHLPPTESVHGLICFQESATAIVWNPSKKQFLTLTKPRNSWENLTVFLGYDPIEAKHKVMCIPLRRSSDVCRVLTLGSTKESWRTVKIIHNKHRSDYHTSGRCIKGVIYYSAYVPQRNAWFLMSFDVRSEKFGVIDLPSLYYKDIYMLINYEGRLACVDRNVKNKLWILEDAEKNKWSSTQSVFIPCGTFDPSLRMGFSLKGFTHAGELIYAPSTFKKSHYISFCDPATRSFRKFEFQGMADGYYMLHTFPNHI